MIKGTIEKRTIRVIELMGVNLLGGVLSFFLSSSWKGRSLNLILLFCVYLVIYVWLKKDKKVEFLIICIWQYTLMMETIYRFVRYERTPFETYYIFDALCIIFSMEMFVKYGIETIRRDVGIIVYSILLLFGGISFLANRSSFYDFLNGTLLIIKYLGMYLYFSHNGFRTSRLLKYFFVLSMIAFSIEVGLKINVDFRNGLFGYEYTGGLFSLLLASWSAVSLIYVLYKKKKWIVFLACFVVSELCLILMDSKAEIILYGVWVFSSFLLLKQKGTHGRKILGVVASIGGIATIWTIYTAKVTKFTHLEGTSIFGAIKYRLSGTNTIKNDSFSAIVLNEKLSWWKRTIGAGLGSAIPPRYVNWVLKNGKRASELFNIPKYSAVFEKYFSTRYYNMFGVSINYIRYDIGYLGIIILIILDAILIYRIVRVIRMEKIQNRIIGIIALWQFISINFRIINNNFIVQQLPMAISYVIFGMVTFMASSKTDSRNTMCES